ncbi:unnamed protein product [Durusdinium trenchii]|uniref:Uncharacterized protein n=1 Tax=Durusdinium trenchii TaxID=1381693 RepID=A0ABP0MW91_9DINO
MSVNGLRFGADAFSSKGPVETKTGSVIYWGDPQSFHDWEFRVLLKIQILEANEAAARAGLETAEDEKKEREEFEAGLDEEGYEKFPSTEELDSSTSLSEPMRCELLIELSGLTHQEALVIKACAGSPLSFEKVANTLIEHYGSVHLRGGRSLGHQGPSMGSGKGKPSTHKGKGKGRNPWHTGYFAETTSVQDDWEEEFAEDIVEDEEPLVGLLAGADEEEPEEDEYEHEEVEEWESIALNAMADLEGSPDIDASSLGESIQLQIAALELSDEVVEAVVAHFNEQVSYQTGHTAASLHQILDEALVANANEQDPLEDDGSFEFPEPTSFTAVAVNQTTGDVMLNLPTVDVMDPDDPHVYAALDEGCNTTCHSSAWGEMATKKLEARGYSFQWKEDADAQDGEESIYGYLESYEADEEEEQDTPEAEDDEPMEAVVVEETRLDELRAQVQASKESDRGRGVVESCNEHDRMTWIGSDAAPQKEKVRMQIRVRGTPDPTIPEDVEVESEEEESPVVEEQGRSRDLIVEGDNQDFNSASPKMKALILEAMRGEWGKFEHYSAAVLISGPDLEKLPRQGHTIIPSKWVLVDKHEYLKGKKEYTPKIKDEVSGNVWTVKHVM